MSNFDDMTAPQEPLSRSVLKWTPVSLLLWALIFAAVNGAF